MERLYEEVAYIAYHFHWPLEDIQRWVEEIAKINQQLSGGNE